MTAVAFEGLEVSQAWANFTDPISGSGGFSETTTGLQPLPEPQVGALGVVLVLALAARATRRAR
jgi:hypothetical protein